MSEELVYVYAVGDGVLADSAEVREMSGVEGSAVRTLSSGGLVAVVSSVDAARFGEGALRRAFEDLRWLENTARAHHAVIDALARAHTVAPMRMATLYLDDTNVLALLAAQAGGLRAALDRIRGRAEWGVKAFAARSADVEQAEVPRGAGPGTSYLMRRRSQREQAARSQAQTRESAERVHHTLTELAVASRRYPPQDPRLSGEPDEMVLNAAYLVEESDMPMLRGAIARCNDDGSLRVEMTGPWAAYSFTTLADS
jgi:hypothetical protein